MTAPLNLEEGQSSTRPHRFNGQVYSCWKTRIHDFVKREGMKDKNLALNTTHSDNEIDDVDMAYLTKKIKMIINKNHGFTRKENVGRSQSNADLCHGCGKPGLFIIECPHTEGDHKDEPRYAKAKFDRRDQVPTKKSQKDAAADRIVKKAFAVWGDNSSDSEGTENPDDASLLVVKDDEEICTD